MPTSTNAPRIGFTFINTPERCPRAIRREARHGSPEDSQASRLDSYWGAPAEVVTDEPVLGSFDYDDARNQIVKSLLDDNWDFLFEGLRDRDLDGMANTISQSTPVAAYLATNDMPLTQMASLISSVLRASGWIGRDALSVETFRAMADQVLSVLLGVPTPTPTPTPAPRPALTPKSRPALPETTDFFVDAEWTDLALMEDSARVTSTPAPAASVATAALVEDPRLLAVEDVMVEWERASIHARRLGSQATITTAEAAAILRRCLGV